MKSHTSIVGTLVFIVAVLATVGVQGAWAEDTSNLCQLDLDASRISLNSGSEQGADEDFGTDGDPDDFLGGQGVKPPPPISTGDDEDLLSYVEDELLTSYWSLMMIRIY